MTKVFISYSHDSDAHRDFVRGLSDRLRADGLDCQIDQYVNGFPPEGWQRWMETQVETADFVLLVCTPDYLKRFRGLETDGGRGGNFEGVVISQALYDHYYRNTKFVSVIPDDGNMADVPLPLKGFGMFRVMTEYEGVYRFLTGQAAVVAPAVGEKLILGDASGFSSQEFDDKYEESQHLLLGSLIRLFRLFSLCLVLLLFFQGDARVEAVEIKVYVRDSKGVAIPYVSLSFAGQVKSTNSKGVYHNENYHLLRKSVLMIARKDGYYEWRDFVNLKNPFIEIVLNEN